MNWLLASLLTVPLAACALIAVLPRIAERGQSRIALTAATLHCALAFGTVCAWLVFPSTDYEWYLGDLYRNAEYRFPVVLYVDAAAATFLAVAAFLSAIVVRYSRYYLHREVGYRRFFTTIFLFVFGIDLLVLAGTLDMLFAGWEIVGIASFVLIAFYRDRAQPTRHAVATYSIYRLCDIGLLLGAWLGHLIWHRSQHFSSLSAAAAGLEALPLLGLSLLCLLAASGKSAQFPFCFWLPRAMEGPTPSSAIFYGALSVHAGVFLLIRTLPVWYASTGGRVAVAGVGLLSAMTATVCGRVQSNIKGQIAYASITQVGLMLIELSLGFRNLVLVHMASNACLRCYQLLVSPSVVAHLLRIQASTRIEVSDWSHERLLPNRWRSTWYVFALNEGYLEAAVRAAFWTPLTALGRLVQRIDGTATRNAAVVTAGVLLALRLLFPSIPPTPLVAVAMTLMALATFTAVAERNSAFRAWNAVGFSCVMAALAVALPGPGERLDIGIYIGGIVPSWLTGLAALRALSKQNRTVPATFLFLAFLGMTGFTFTPSFLGEDLLLHHAAGDTFWLAPAIALAFVANGITLARLHARLCWGPEDRAAPVTGRETTGPERRAARLTSISASSGPSSSARSTSSPSSGRF